MRHGKDTLLFPRRRKKEHQDPGLSGNPEVKLHETEVLIHTRLSLICSHTMMRIFSIYGMSHIGIEPFTGTT